jgi:hypothetical protein
MRVVRVTDVVKVGAANDKVRVLCLGCARWVGWIEAFVDFDGPAFEAFYHEECVPKPGVQS